MEARDKDLRHVDFDLDLDLAPYMAPDVDALGGTRYQLTGVIEQRHEYLSTSYYTACVRGPKGEWRAMNNTLLHEVAVEEVRRRQPYILFYSRGGAKLPSQPDVPGGTDGATCQQGSNHPTDRTGGANANDAATTVC
ncbi:hypothetical protein Vretifemale_16861 [Volvox reticuliferus]|uniref:USP domain-containing protein n=1 Tax=Volvox reticuliferus TaxID=1737510 RepID=A0A8J4CU16_9CHLO|nr:hypothetical protein Vretifemale_16861 [Volvox reticuliferus]